MAGRPKKNPEAPAKEVKAKADPKGVSVVEKETVGAPQSVSANDYVNSLIGQHAAPIRVEGHNENEQQIGSYIEESGEVTEQQLAELKASMGEVNINTPANVYTGELPKLNAKDPIDKIQEHLNLNAIIEKYEQVCDTPSDINQLLPYLRAVADECDHITELGVRTPTSTWALLAGNPKQLVSYDIVKDPKVAEVEDLAPNFKFVLGSSLEVEIEETDFLFIDTYHSALQLEKELALHASKVSKYLGFHDIHSFGDRSEPPYPGIVGDLNDGRGLNYAIYPFLQDHPEWQISFRTHINNGLLILKRIS